MKLFKNAPLNLLNNKYFLSLVSMSSLKKLILACNSKGRSQNYSNAGARNGSATTFHPIPVVPVLHNIHEAPE
jgi:hypothetical protein